MAKNGRKPRKTRRDKQLERLQKEVPVRERLKALTKRQGDYIKAVYTGDQVFTLGPAGTGKTYIAAAIAADMLAEGKIEKIVLSRPAVGVDEEHGFLPGNIQQKIAPWIVPFTEVMQKRLGKDRFRQAMANGEIEVVPIAYMRGRTFDNALVFLDEAQNTTYSQIKMFLTRIGENSKVIINGDIRQTDLDETSGLAAVLAMIETYQIPVPVIEFTNADVVRSGICKLWTAAFEQFEEDVEDPPASIGFNSPTVDP